MAKATQILAIRGFGDRLLHALDIAGIRPSPTLADRKFNLRFWGKSITPHTARNWLLRKSTPMQRKLRVLADWLQVRSDALRYGALAMETKPQDREMLKRYLSLPQDNRKTMHDVVTSLALAASIARKHWLRQDAVCLNRPAHWRWTAAKSQHDFAI